MGTRFIEFGVVFVRRVGADLVVAGRCNEGPIKLGDTFALAYRYTQRSTAEGGPAVHPTRSDDRPVALRVGAIRAYRESLSEVHAGTTAELTLADEGKGEVHPGDVLAGTV